MKYSFIHLSDVHYQDGCPEKRPAFRPFLEDIERQLGNLSGEKYLVLSGDVARAADDKDDYRRFEDLLDPLLARHGIGFDRRICIPGNHDVSRSSIKAVNVEHEALISHFVQRGESAVNDSLAKFPESLQRKFDFYLEFERGFAKYGIRENIVGAGHSLSEDVGVYCLNTAFMSFGGLPDSSGNYSDKRRLGIATRPLVEWLENSQHSVRILVCHHPMSWLTDWAASGLNRLLPKFNLVLTGHEHSPISERVIRDRLGFVSLAAPALLTDSRTPMGYAITEISVNGAISIFYREWSDKGVFVAGARMAGTEDGIIRYAGGSDLAVARPISIAGNYFDDGLARTLKAFGKRGVLPWVEPQIFSSPETDRGKAKSKQYLIDDLIVDTDNCLVRSPPQYGLSGLSWRLCRRALDIDPEKVWVRIDMALTKPHDVRDEIASMLNILGRDKSELSCVVVDSWAAVRAPEKCVAAIRRDYPGVRLVLLETQSVPTLDSVAIQLNGTSFKALYLWAQNRSGLRAIVSHFREAEQLDADIEALLTRVVRDLQALNLPRTPLNCLTMLLVSSASGDPLVNRAEVINKILSIVFESEASLTYRSRADKTDCEYLLGYFAEHLIRDEKTRFTREQFISHGRNYCAGMLVDVDVSAVLGLLLEHDIIIASGADLTFRFSYWVYYFAAARMHHNTEFRDYIFSDMQYTRFPEVVEFYTGIDRRRADALEALAADLSRLHEDVRAKTNVPAPSQLFGLFKWNVDTSNAEQMMKALESDVLGSSLPQEVKDRYADRAYDAARPYDQEIKSLLRTYSFKNLTAGLQASARALRNSDYVHPSVKGRLFDSLMDCWEQVLSVLVLISPLLAEKGEAEFYGTKFVLEGDGAGSEKVAVTRIWSYLPYNVISWFRDDLTSAKMGPLLYSRLKRESDALKRHSVALLICAIRPSGWSSEIQAYASDIPRDSFYLLDLGNFLISEHTYAYLSDKEISVVAHAVRYVFAKRYFGNDRPSEKMIKQVSVPDLDRRAEGCDALA